VWIHISHAIGSCMCSSQPDRCSSLWRAGNLANTRLFELDQPLFSNQARLDGSNPKRGLRPKPGTPQLLRQPICLKPRPTSADSGGGLQRRSLGPRQAGSRVRPFISVGGSPGQSHGLYQDSIPGQRDHAAEHLPCRSVRANTGKPSLGGVGLTKLSLETPHGSVLVSQVINPSAQL